MNNMEKILDVKNLRISFRTNNGRVKAVRDINFDLNKGETIAIVGESGSGKSVTARAIMGILAPNAIVEGGEIIYDGKDLMKISEEEFHQLRGNRVSMIFQDPLSSLNPIVRIGKQLTEAMILNGKSTQKDAKKIFNDKTSLLCETMTKAGISDAKESIAILKKFIEVSNKSERAYNEAQEKIIDSVSHIDGIIVDIAGDNTKAAGKAVSELLKLLTKVYNPFLIHEGDAKIASLAKDIKELAAKYSHLDEKEAAGQGEELKNKLTELKNYLEAADDGIQPNFFTLGYYLAFQTNPKSEMELSENIEEMNKMTRKCLDDGFMLKFLDEVAQALKYADEIYDKEREDVAKATAEMLDFLNSESIDLKELKEREKKLVKEVDESLNHLDIIKDSIAYTFESAFGTAVETYIQAMHLKAKKKLNKKEQVVFDNTDMDLVLDNMKIAVERLKEDYETKINSENERDYANAAVSMIDYLKEQAAKMVYKVSRAMAKARAIKLMEEVGIPEARKRYKQYPFEFSGGMRQRIVIAIALSANPDILICDEPTTALDVTIQSQILELINSLKEKRKLSVIFITHDLGVVANMADKIAVMYAGKIVEYGSVDEIFYDPKHPYTWALLSSMPDLYTQEKLEAIPGTPPNMIHPPKGDAFAARNKYAMKIDFEKQPPMFKVTDTHYAATWLLHPNAPKVEPPAIVTERIARMKGMEAGSNE